MKKILLVALFLRLIFIFGGYHPDLGNHIDWGIKFWEYGPKSFYGQSIWNVSWPNQPPGNIYLWALMAKIKDGLGVFLWWLNVNLPVFPSNLLLFLEPKLHPALVKLPSIFSEIGIGWLIYLLVKKLKDDKTAKWASMIFLFNPITIYNSAIWGQTDGLINFFGLLSIYLFFIKKLTLGVFTFFLSLYLKTSLVIFTPIILILFLKQKYSFKQIAISFLSSLVLITTISLPFIHNQNPFRWLFDLYIVRVFGHQGNMLTANAFNLWALIFNVDFFRTDEGRFLFFNLGQWGRGLFSLISLITLVILLKGKLNWEKIFFSLMIVAFSAFVLLTNMHERYLYPVFPYLAILAVLNRRLIIFYFILVVFHLLNLYHLWYYPPLDTVQNFLSNGLTVKALSLGIILVYLVTLKFFVFSSINNAKIKK